MSWQAREARYRMALEAIVAFDASCRNCYSENTDVKRIAEAALAPTIDLTPLAAMTGSGGVGIPGWHIEPVDGESYKGRQWGWTLYRHGSPERWYIVAGGTGPCWNIRAPGGPASLHVCDLSDFIAALQTLEASDIHNQATARWKVDP